MKVLFVCSLYYPHVGGIETMIAELADFYRQRGITSTVLTKKWPLHLPEHERYQGVNIHRIISARLPDEFRAVVDWLKKNDVRIRADIIHVVGVRRPLPLIALLLARMWGVPVICTIAGGDIPDERDPQPTMIWEEGKEFIPYVLQQADSVTCVSQALVKDLEKIMPTLHNVKVLYAGIDSSGAKNSQSGALPRPYILSLRRLDASKGIDILIRAFAGIMRRFPSITLVIAGSGPQEGALRRLVQELSLGSRVSFIGTVSQSEGYNILKDADCTVVPSLSEGGGLVNVMAQAVGCPVVASRVGGIPEYVIDNVSGILFEPGNVDDLTQKMEAVLTDVDLRNRIITGGFAHAERFSWEVLSPQYIALYNEVISAHDSGRSFYPWSDLVLDLWYRMIKKGNA